MEQNKFARGWIFLSLLADLDAALRCMDPKITPELYLPSLDC